MQIKKIKEKGKTIVLTTHYMEEAQVLCDRIAVMDNAKILALDTPHNLIKKYAQTSHIIFHTDKEIPQEKLKVLKEVQEVKKQDDTYELKVLNIEDAVHDLVELSKKEKIMLQELDIQTITLTTAASQAVQSILTERRLEGYALRVYVAGGGCCGRADCCCRSCRSCRSSRSRLRPAGLPRPPAPARSCRAPPRRARDH